MANIKNIKDVNKSIPSISLKHSFKYIKNTQIHINVNANIEYITIFFLSFITIFCSRTVNFSLTNINTS